MMKKIQFIAFAMVIILSGACDTEDPMVEGTGTLSLKFEAKFNGEPLFTDQEYQLPDGKKARIKQLNFFISDATVNFIEAGTAQIEDLTTVEFVELTQSADNLLEATDNTFQFFNMPEGQYSNIDFTFGLDKTLNDKSPSDQDLGDSSPLSRSSHYWAGWGSYIFMKLEGTIDFNEDGTLDNESENIVYHTGSDNDGSGDDQTAHQSVSMPFSFDITRDGTTEVIVSIDIRDVLYDADGAPNWDIEGRSTTHNPDDFDLVQEIMAKTAESFKMIE